MLNNIPNQLECRRCKEIKLLDANNFWVSKSGKYGFTRICSTCLKLQKTNNYHKNVKENRIKNNAYKKSIALTKIAPTEKRCIKCACIKQIGEFYIQNSRPDGYDVYCKPCHREIKRKDYHKDIVKSRKQNSENRKRRQVKENIANIKDPNKNLRRRMRSRIWHGLKRQGLSKNMSTYEFLGCDYNELKRYLFDSFKFRNGFDLDNDDFFDIGGDYNIDHIIPCEAFDLTNDVSRKLCFNFSNLQIISFDENMRKSDYLPDKTRARYLSEHQKIKTLDDYNFIRYGKDNHYYNDICFDDVYCF